MSVEFWRMGATPVPVSEIGRFAREFEASGWDGLAVGEAHGLLPDPYVTLAVAAGATTTLKVGTGGYAAQIAQGMFRAIANVAGEVTTQYIIRYIPEGSEDAKTFRNIKVTVPDLPTVKVRTRKGYYAEIPQG